jgi:hypothetical protein
MPNSEIRRLLHTLIGDPLHYTPGPVLDTSCYDNKFSILHPLLPPYRADTNCSLLTFNRGFSQKDGLNPWFLIAVTNKIEMVEWATRSFVLMFI